MIINKIKEILLFKSSLDLKKEWSDNLYPTGPISLDYIEELYSKYRIDLIAVRKYQRSHYKKFIGPTRSAYGDIECELTYLFLREMVPNTVVEISPWFGWSTSWILHALRDNGSGYLYSYDQLVDFPWSDASPSMQLPCLSTLPEELMDGRFILTEGDVRQQTNIPDSIDYLFIDSEHTSDFAKWFIKTLFPRIKKGSVTSVHDIEGNGYNDDFLAGTPYKTNPGENGEDRQVLDYLKSSNINFFHTAVFLNEIRKIRKTKGIKGTIRKNYVSMTLFFKHP